MMGDNRDNSDDSRYWGFVPDDHIAARRSSSGSMGRHQLCLQAGRHRHPLTGDTMYGWDRQSGISIIGFMFVITVVLAMAMIAFAYCRRTSVLLGRRQTDAGSARDGATLAMSAGLRSELAPITSTRYAAATRFRQGRKRADGVDLDQDASPRRQRQHPARPRRPRASRRCLRRAWRSLGHLPPSGAAAPRLTHRKLRRRAQRTSRIHRRRH